MPDGIHDEHPFATPTELRDPTRRLRGRLTVGVTVITSGTLPRAVGLTVSSVLVAEGAPSRILALVDPETAADIRSAGLFVVHVLEEGQQALSDRFAGLRPSPGGLFGDLDVRQSHYGPVLEDVRTRAFCTWDHSTEVGYHTLAAGVIDEVEMQDSTAPLVYYRGRYRRLS